MFNLGSNDKEKLKENMEEIKNLVNNQQSSEEVQEDEESGQNQEQPDFSQMNQEAAENNQFNQSLDQTNEQSNIPETEPPQNNDFPNNENDGKELGGQSTQQTSAFSNNPQMNQQDNFSNQEQTQEPQTQTSNSVPTAANFSSKSGETIFLTVERFEQLQDRIEQMRYLSNEIEDVIDHLEAGVQEDDQTQSEAQQLLDDFSSRRSDVEDIITSQEN